jgi:5,10-methylenetetrahydromethanopterin reductase
VTIQFGINFMPTAPAREVAGWARAVEARGFSLLGVSDSPSICRELYTALALCATSTERIRLGPRVITPASRHPAVAASGAATLEELAPGRTMLAIGSGDSAAYNAGLKPVSLAGLTEYTQTIRRLLSEGRADYQGAATRFTWSRPRVPIFLAASGPKTLRLAGQIADGVVVRTGIAPEVVRDSIEQVQRGAKEAGRDPDAVEMWWWPDANVAASRHEAIAEITMSLASAGNHLSRFTTEGKHIPPELLPRVQELGQRYTFGDHVAPGSGNGRLIEELGLVDYLADRFAIVGTPAECIKTIERAVDAGARRFWISIHFDDKQRFLRDWSTRIMPAFR